MPNQFKLALDKSLNTILVPYFENLMFVLNKLQDKSTQTKKNSDVVDELF